MVLTAMILGGVASTGASLAVHQGQDNLAVQAMNHNITDIGAVIEDEVSHYGDALSHLAAAIGAQPDLTAGAFERITASLNTTRLPGATGIGYVVPATDEEIPRVQATWRARGAYRLDLQPGSTGTPHEFVVYVRSFANTSLAPGRDLTGSPQAADALRIARETGAFTVGAAHVLLRDRQLPVAEQQMSFTLAVPVLADPGPFGARALRGWVTMGVRAGDFLSAVLRSQAGGAIHVQLTDPSTGAATVLAEATEGRLIDEPTLHRTRILVVGQHTWHLAMQPTTELLGSADRWLTQATVIAGAVFTLLLATLVGALVDGRNRAMAEVDRKTLALRQDIERREAVERELQNLAFHDPLTGLANRKLFWDRLGQAMRAHSRSGETFAVFFIDLDGFKQVNDELGHGCGDLVLVEVARRLHECLRDSDTVARFGGDEFAVIAERLADAEDVHITAHRIVAAVSRPILMNDGEARISASVGIALNRPGAGPDDILRDADVAMYEAKSTGKSRHVLAPR